MTATRSVRHDGERLSEAVRNGEPMQAWRTVIRRLRASQVVVGLVLCGLLSVVCWAVFHRLISDALATALTAAVACLGGVLFRVVGKRAPRMPHALDAWGDHPCLRRLLLVGDGIEQPRTLELELGREPRSGPTILLRARCVRDLHIDLIAESPLNGGLRCREVPGRAPADGARFEISGPDDEQLRFRCASFEIVEGG